MKKVLLVSMLASVGLFAFPSDSTLISDQTSTNDIMNVSNKIDFVSGKNEKQVGGQLIFAEDLMILNVPMSFRMNDAVTVDLNVPIINAQGGSGVADSTDIGDVSIGANYQSGDYTSDTGLHLTTIRYKSTTGDATRFLGSGKPAYTVAYNYAKNNSDELRLNAYASYTLNDKFVTGDAISLMGGATYKLSDQRDAHVKLSYLDTAQEGFNNGYTEANLWLEVSSKDLVEGMHLGAGIKVPIIDDINFPGGVTVDGLNSVVFYISTTSFFPETK